MMFSYLLVVAGVEAERDDGRDDIWRESREFRHEGSCEARAVLPFIGCPGAGRRDLFNVSALRSRFIAVATISLYPRSTSSTREWSAAA